MILSTGAVFIHIYLSRLLNKSMQFLLWKLSQVMIIFAVLAMVFAFLHIFQCWIAPKLLLLDLQLIWASLLFNKTGENIGDEMLMKILEEF